MLTSDIRKMLEYNAEIEGYDVSGTLKKKYLRYWYKSTDTDTQGREVSQAEWLRLTYADVC